MATSESQNPSSSSNPGGRYDIFLSFRGLDTRKKFTDHLYHALVREGFRTFRDDDEIERGEDIKLELREAIRNSRMSVIVLSENYASSTACLCELQAIVKLCKKSDHFCLPVFYEVEPEELKEQSKNLVFEEKEVMNVEKVKGWSAALNEVASMAGMVSRKESHGYEAKFIEKIVGELKSKLPGKQLRVGDHLGTEKIEGLVLDMNMLRNSNMVVLETNTFEKMYNLRLLKLSGVQLSGTSKTFPKRLRWLFWRGFPLESFPNDFPLENLVVLDMRYSNLKQVIWKGTKVLGALKILNLGHSPKLGKTPDFSRIPNLEKLVLKACPSLFEVHESIVELQRIESLNLQDCKNLRKLPRNIGMVESLVEIDISGCSNLMGAIEELEKMKSLQVLNASRMEINRVLTVKLVSQASIWPWIPRPRIQMSLASLPSSLVRLDLSYCNLTEDAFPRDLSKLSKLQHLFLAGNPFSSLPNFIRDLTGLQTLDLSLCEKLKQIRWSSTILQDLYVFHCKSLEKITFETGTDIRNISCSFCHNLNHVQRHFKILPVTEVDVELINSIGFFNLNSMADAEVTIRNYISYWVSNKRPIQIVNEGNLLNTFFPGREVPHWFSNKNSGSTISFTATLSPHFGFRGWNLCVVYTLQDDREYASRYFYFEINNKSSGMKTVSGIHFYGMPEKGGDMVWLSHCFQANLFTEGDEVEISFIITRGGQIKECGVHLLYFEEEGQVVQYVSTIQRSWDLNLSPYEPESVAQWSHRATRRMQMGVTLDNLLQSKVHPLLAKDL